VATMHFFFLRGHEPLSNWVDKLAGYDTIWDVHGLVRVSGVMQEGLVVLSASPTSQTVKLMFLYSTVSTLNPICVTQCATRQLHATSLRKAVRHQLQGAKSPMPAAVGATAKDSQGKTAFDDVDILLPWEWL
jgi:hypothetical protein